MLNFFKNYPILNKLKYIHIYLSLAIFFILLGIIKVIVPYTNVSIMSIQIVGLTFICLILFYNFILFKHKALTVNKIALTIFIIGFIVRVCYILYTPSYYNQHDVFDDNGHFDYMMNIAEKFNLPNSNKWQFYHPPLNNIVMAVFIRLFMLFGADNMYVIASGLQAISCFYTCAIMLIAWNIINISGISKNTSVLVYTIFCLHPTFYILSGSINNDNLMLLFFFASVYYCIKWYHKPNKKTSCLLGVCFGLSLMAKISAVLILPAIAFTFILKLVKLSKLKNNIKPIFIQGLLFCIISVVLGLWYPIRNFILFNQPINYVTQISKKAAIYTGDTPLMERLSLIDINSLKNIKDSFCNPFDDYNIPLYLIKSSIFGEYSFENINIVSVALLITNTILIIISLICLIYVFIKNKNKIYIKIMNLLIWIVQITSYIMFNIKYAFGCSMDFRYLVPTILTGAIFIGLTVDELKKKDKNSNKLINNAIYITSITFCVLGVLTFLTLKY